MGRAGGQVADGGRWREGGGGPQIGSDNKRRETAIRRYSRQSERVGHGSSAVAIATVTLAVLLS